MPIVHSQHGFTSITGDASLSFFRLATLLSGLRFEIRTNGMKLTRGPSCYTRIKKEFGFKGNREAVYSQFDAYVKAMKATVEIIEEPKS